MDPDKELTYYCDSQRHLVCVPFSVDNLHLMAADLGIKRCWFHGGDKPHYDIPKRRISEIQKRCVVVRPREILKIIKDGGSSDLYYDARFAFFGGLA